MEIVKRVYPAIAEANIMVIMHSILDHTCLALRPVTMETEGMVEDIIPDIQIPPREQIAVDVLNIKPITHDQKDILISLFDDISIAHERLGQAAGTISSLCKVMNPEQLILIMKCSIQPLIHLSVSPGLFDPLIWTEKKELPEDTMERI